MKTKCHSYHVFLVCNSVEVDFYEQKKIQMAHTFFEALTSDIIYQAFTKLADTQSFNEFSLYFVHFDQFFSFLGVKKKINQ